MQRFSRPPMKMPITWTMSVSIFDDGKFRNENTNGSAGRGRNPSMPVSAISSTSTPSALSSNADSHAARFELPTPDRYAR